MTGLRIWDVYVRAREELSSYTLEMQRGVMGCQPKKKAKEIKEFLIRGYFRCCVSEGVRVVVVD